MKIENDFSVVQNITGDIILNIEEDLTVDKEMSVKNNIASTSELRIGNNLSMPKAYLQIFNNEYDTEKEHTLLYVEGYVFEVRQLDIAYNETNIATKLVVIENADFVSTDN